MIDRLGRGYSITIGIGVTPTLVTRVIHQEPEIKVRRIKRGGLFARGVRYNSYIRESRYGRRRYRLYSIALVL